jgi:cardiolipin synthase
LTLRRILLGFSKLNQRNHRKVYLIDQKIAYTGSANITSEHLRSVHGAKAWRDTGVRLQGEGVDELHQAFLEAWNYHVDYYGRHHPFKKFARFLQVVRVNWNKEYRKLYYETLMEQIQRAKTQIWITNPYFVPDRKLMKALEQAALARVDVQIIFPFHSDFIGVKLAMEGLYGNLLKAGVRIFEYLPSMLHAKVLILDKWVTVGSSNLNHRSLFNDLEADAVICRPENIEALRQQFLMDRKQCRAIEWETWKRRPVWKKVLEKFFLVFRTFL